MAWIQDPTNENAVPPLPLLATYLKFSGLSTSLGYFTKGPHKFLLDDDYLAIGLGSYRLVVVMGAWERVQLRASIGDLKIFSETDTPLTIHQFLSL